MKILNGQHFNEKMSFNLMLSSIEINFIRIEDI